MCAGRVALTTTDVVLHIATFLPSLTDLVRLWLSAKELMQSFPPNDASFWSLLTHHFLQSRHITKEDATRSLSLCPPPPLKRITVSIATSSSSLFADDDSLCAATSDFSLVESLFSTKKCSRSGCHQWFQEWSNSRSACAYHPGRLRGRVLSCCRAASFRAPGCKTADHSGLFHSLVHSQRGEDDRCASRSLPLIAEAAARSTKTPHSAVSVRVSLPTIR